MTQIHAVYLLAHCLIFLTLLFEAICSFICQIVVENIVFILVPFVTLLFAHVLFLSKPGSVGDRQLAAAISLD